MVAKTLKKSKGLMLEYKNDEAIYQLANGVTYATDRHIL